MRKRLLNLAVIITSLLGYLQWGKDNEAFLFQMEGEVILKMITHAAEALHPFTVLPMAGQVLLLITCFQKTPSRILSLTGLACIGFLLLFIFGIGIFALNFKMILSCIPFLIVASFSLRANWTKTATE